MLKKLILLQISLLSFNAVFSMKMEDDRYYPYLFLDLNVMPDENDDNPILI